ncbi:19070_t:CDS:2, partial [Racocetra fulgida]
TVGLTYDDGPNCSHTVFYNFLKENNQKATMFFIGSNVVAFLYEAQRALTDGHQHELNNGTMSKAIEWYPKIKNAYKHVVPIASCMNVTQPYTESNYTYPSFAEYINKNSASTSKA